MICEKHQFDYIHNDQQIYMHVIWKLFKKQHMWPVRIQYSFVPVSIQIHHFHGEFSEISSCLVWCHSSHIHIWKLWICHLHKDVYVIFCCCSVYAQEIKYKIIQSNFVTMYQISWHPQSIYMYQTCFFFCRKFYKTCWGTNLKNTRNNNSHIHKKKILFVDRHNNVVVLFEDVKEHSPATKNQPVK